jgi:hypothetical protein
MQVALPEYAKSAYERCLMGYCTGESSISNNRSGPKAPAVRALRLVLLLDKHFLMLLQVQRDVEPPSSRPKRGIGSDEEKERSNAS